MFSSICVWINGWENNREAGDLIRYRAHYWWHHCNVVDAIVKGPHRLCCLFFVSILRKVRKISKHNILGYSQEPHKYRACFIFHSFDIYQLKQSSGENPFCISISAAVWTQLRIPLQTRCFFSEMACSLAFEYCSAVYSVNLQEQRMESLGKS